MYDDFLLDNNYNDQNPDLSSVSNTTTLSNDIDELFDNLSNDISTFNRYVSDINDKKKENSLEQKELQEEKERLKKEKEKFEEYVKAKNAENAKKKAQIDEYLDIQKKNLLKSELEFKASMDSSLNELELSKKELEIKREKLKEDKEQFETYKGLELERIKHAQEIFDSDKEQFEKYKEVTTRKIELENKNLEQKFDKFKMIISQFNKNFKPIIEENKE